MHDGGILAVPRFGQTKFQPSLAGLMRCESRVATKLDLHAVDRIDIPRRTLNHPHS